MRLGRWACGVALAPFAAGCLWSAASALFGATATRAAAPFLAGFAGYLLAHVLVWKPVTLYVLGHEMSHALAAWMGGAKVYAVSVGQRGGHVDLSRSSAWIALAPYVLPVYAVFAVAAYRLVLWWAPSGGPGLLGPEGLRSIFLLAMGASLSFHLTHTVEILWSRRQPDLDMAGGAVFSLPLIAAANGLVLLAALKCLFPKTVSLARALEAAWGIGAGFWRAAGEGLLAVVAGLSGGGGRP